MTIKTDTQFAEFVDQLARDHRSLNVLEAAEQRDITTIRDKRRDRIDALKDSISVAKAVAARYLRKHRAALIPAGRRSAETHLAEYGLRTSTSIVALSKDWDAERTLEALIEQGRHDCIITTQRINKDALAQLDDETLASVGLRKRPSETFWVQPKSGTSEKISTRED